MSKSNYEDVVEFTEGSTRTLCPTVPQKMSKQEVTHLLKMILSECVELAETVTESVEEASELVRNSMGVDLHSHKKEMDELDIIAEQGDALVDIWYYSLNAASKKGINLSKIFDAVHVANMDKRDLETKQFIIREDGKVLKRPGWTAPCIRNVLFPNNTCFSEAKNEVFNTLEVNPAENEVHSIANSTTSTSTSTSANGSEISATPADSLV